MHAMPLSGGSTLSICCKKLLNVYWSTASVVTPCLQSGVCCSSSLSVASLHLCAMNLSAHVCFHGYLRTLAFVQYASLPAYLTLDLAIPLYLHHIMPLQLLLLILQITVYLGISICTFHISPLCYGNFLSVPMNSHTILCPCSWTMHHLLPH